MAKSKNSSGPTGPATKIVSRMYKNRVALSDDVKKQIVDILQVRLAEASDLYSQAKFAHWNVKGNNFYQLHKLFDHVAEEIEEQIDPIAERLTQLGGVANGTNRQASMTSTLAEFDVELEAGMDFVRVLADRVGAYAANMREASDKIGDLGDDPTSDFFNQLIVDAEEQLYFLESHLEAGDVQ